MAKADPATSQGDFYFKWLTAICSLITPLLMAGIFLELVAHSLPSIKKFGFGFLISQNWNPVTEQFGGASSIYGTLVSTLIAMAIAVPLSIAIALFLVELAPGSARWCPP